MTEPKPAWSRESAWLRLPFAAINDFSPTWAFGNSTGRGVRVAIIDSGIEASHPALGSAVDQAGSIEFGANTHGGIRSRTGPHHDVYGHGTACAGIIHALAPDAVITSVRVLDERLRGTAAAFHAGLTWAVDEEFDIINLSLGAAKRDWALAFHDTCDRGYFANSFIVTAANNINRDSFPSLFASVTSVAANNSADPLRFHFNPEPPTEFLARGIDVEVPWLNGTTIVTTGNSFAAPHIAAFAALIRAEHPELRPFQIKTALWAASANVREATGTDHAGRAGRATVGPSRATLRGTSDPPPALGAPPPSPPGTVLGPQPTQRAPAAGFDDVWSPTVDAVDSASSAPDERTEVQELMVDYEVGELIARGPWGPVFAATNAGTPVALRRLDPTMAFDRPTRDRFAASVRIASTLAHPNILPILELREGDDIAVMAMPLCSSNLAQWSQDHEPDIGAAVVAVLSLLRGLHHAHAAGIYHGDLRPENALIDDRNQVLLSDVGVASALTSDVRTSSAPHDPLSWTYLAPEQLEGGAIGAFTDIYACGLLFYELAGGALPYPGVTDLGSLVRQRARSGPRPLRLLAPQTPEAIAVVVERAVADDPVQRYASAWAMVEALATAADATLEPGWHGRQPFRIALDGRGR